jgi:hypothetical protein
MTNKELENLKRRANKILIKDYCKKYPIRGMYNIGKALMKKYF